ncbi:cyclin-dependent kinase F-4 [Prunus yedoensis var. nudiflora]|uniref:Cyclin-dependent kinase F-4 n=1 Tax=Prunus yedoensis var. nudiflora TaxID=2094558 RepID=A0A314YJG4_PRUYE|nr:cyclin-dependent kinase F-4 [Prunus yedoensis var. nudiflora]
MENYWFLKPLGEGSFGVVWKALHKVTGEIVAIKQLKNEVLRLTSWEEFLQMAEVESLSQLKSHPNIVNLKQAFMEVDGTASLEWCHQILLGLDHMHKNGWCHRDLKPDNLLVKQGVVKIGDLGSAKKIQPGIPFKDYVTTRWYRAPEVLLGSCFYDSKVDMWAVGVILAEMFNLRPLLPGQNVEDQLFSICRVLGSPTMKSWPEGQILAGQLITSLLSWDPAKRPTAAEALKHPFFVGSHRIPRAIPRAIPERHHHILPNIGGILAQQIL